MVHIPMLDVGIDGVDTVHAALYRKYVLSRDITIRSPGYPPGKYPAELMPQRVCATESTVLSIHRDAERRMTAWDFIAIFALRFPHASRLRAERCSVYFRFHWSI